jgi:hypothetical protein
MTVENVAIPAVSIAQPKACNAVAIYFFIKIFGSFVLAYLPVYLLPHTVQVLPQQAA